MHHWVKFGLNSTDDLGILVIDPGYRKKAEQEKTEFSVPFSDKSNIILHPHFKPYERVMKFASSYERLKTVYNWLQGSGVLRTSIDRSVFFNAMVVDVSEQKLYEQGQLLLTAHFMIDPFAFLISGLDKIVVNAPNVIRMIPNPGTWESRPIYKVYGNGTGTIIVNGQSMIITGMTNDLTIDCERKIVYKDQINQGNKMVGEFLGFSPGGNTIAFSGGISRLEIVPRWCEL